MKWLASCGLAFLLFASSCATVQAQGVYVTRGENGPVFSDKPQTGSKEVNLKPLNVVPSQQGASQAEKAGQGQGATGKRGDQDDLTRGPGPQGKGVPAYRSFSIISPEDNGSVAGDSSVFEVRLAVDPPLLLGDGHAFLVRINGRFVEQRFTATEFMIPPGFWAEGYLPANQSMQLEASIVDGVGQVLMRSAPVVFHSRQVAIQPGFYPGYPVYAPPVVRPGKPPHKPKPPPNAPEEPRRATGRKMQ